MLDIPDELSPVTRLDKGAVVPSWWRQGLPAIATILRGTGVMLRKRWRYRHQARSASAQATSPRNASSSGPSRQGLWMACGSTSACQNHTLSTGIAGRSSGPVSPACCRAAEGIGSPSALFDHNLCRPPPPGQQRAKQHDQQQGGSAVWPLALWSPRRVPGGWLGLRSAWCRLRGCTRVRCLHLIFRPVGVVIRAPVGKQRLEHLTLCRSFDQQSTEQGVQAGAIERWFERKESSESVNVSRADWHTVDPQGGKEIAKFRQGRGLSGGIVRTQSARLDVRFINTLPVLMASRHSRESGNPGGKSPGDWMPACAGMTFYWRQTYKTDIQYSATEICCSSCAASPGKHRVPRAKLRVLRYAYYPSRCRSS